MDSTGNEAKKSAFIPLIIISSSLLSWQGMQLFLHANELASLKKNIEQADEKAAKAFEIRKEIDKLFRDIAISAKNGNKNALSVIAALNKNNISIDITAKEVPPPPK